jgi:hypothetical protein
MGLPELVCWQDNMAVYLNSGIFGKCAGNVLAVFSGGRGKN